MYLQWNRYAACVRHKRDVHSTARGSIRLAFQLIPRPERCYSSERAERRAPEDRASHRVTAQAHSACVGSRKASRSRWYILLGSSATQAPFGSIQGTLEPSGRITRTKLVWSADPQAPHFPAGLGPVSLHFAAFRGMPTCPHAQQMQARPMA